ncbi:TPA: hypothetical protein EYP66_07315 [Candidatus Poribacteria bacterium]|nr:hypothetical protein [Candidatus Poribacteria bacterium]
MTKFIHWFGKISLIGFPKRISLIAVVVILGITPPISSQITDPLGNRVFDKSGKELYKINATYGILEGMSAIRRDAEFGKQTGLRHFFIFDIPGANVQHQLAVGHFATRFSDFTLNKELFDSVRWNITVPKARGRVSAFLGRVTNNTFSISDEQVSPIEDKNIESNADWFMAGLRAEANLGSWDVKLAGLPGFTMPLPRLGVNYVNRFFTNYDLTRTANPFSGVVINNPPSELYLRFSDGSPENPGGAKVFAVKVYIDEALEYDFAGGKEPPGVLMASRLSFRDDNSRWVDSDGTFVYRFDLFNPQDIKSVRFELDIANDYVVELSTNGMDYRLKLSARGNVSDGSNRDWRRFYYGEMTDETTMGFDLQTTLWGISIEAERAWYMRTRQYPLFGGKRTQRTASAWFVDVNRSFGPFNWRSEYTYIDPFYNAANFVDDNDDEDPYADSREPAVRIYGSSERDRDADGVDDWYDDFLLFSADPPKFRTGLNRESMDFNNNGQPDSLEDDLNPNYRGDYTEGSYGHNSFLRIELPVVKGLSMTPGYYEKRLILDKKSSRSWYNILEYVPEPIQNWNLLFRHTVRRAHDIIPDNWIEDDEIVEDDLSLQNYLGNIFTMKAEYRNPTVPLTIISKFKYQYDALFHTKERLIDTVLINQLRYEYQVRPDLTIAPAFRNDRSIGYSIPYNRYKATDFIRNAYILTLTHQVAEQLQLSSGAQYLTFRDLNEPKEDFNRTVAFLELVIHGQSFGKTMGLLITGDYVIQNYLQPVGGGERSTNISITLFLL